MPARKPCAGRARPRGAQRSLSVDVEGNDGSWLSFDVADGQLSCVEVAVWPPVRLWESLSRTAKGATMPSSTAGGANSSSAPHTAAACSPAPWDCRNRSGP